MARHEFRLPDIGEGLAEAEVSRWLVAEGDRVSEDQPVVEMMTDKATVELPAPGGGVVVERRAAEGDARAVELSLTPRGRKVYDKVVRYRLRVLTRALADWSARDRAELQRLAARLATDLTR